MLTEPLLLAEETPWFPSAPSRLPHLVSVDRIEWTLSCFLAEQTAWRGMVAVSSVCVRVCVGGHIQGAVGV